MAAHSTPLDLQIKPRALHMDSDAPTPRWWLGGDPVATAVMNALSLTFPEGERFFIQSVKRFAKDAPPRLAADIRAFTIQEGAHTREHIAFNAITERSGYSVAEVEAYANRRLDVARSRPPLAQLAATMALEHFTAAFAHRLLADTQFLAGAPPELARLWRWHSIEEIEHKGVAYANRRLDVARSRPPLAQLAATMALEHFTAAFAHRMLADPQFLAGAPPELARLWRWHSIEEIEHKGVAYDVFMHATRDMSGWKRWAIRRWAMLLTTLMFTRTLRDTTLMLLAQDGITGLKARWGLFRFLWLKPGLYRRMLGDYLAFYQPSFHPWQVDDRDLIASAEADLGLAQAA